MRTLHVTMHVAMQRTARQPTPASLGTGRYDMMNDTFAFDIFSPPLQTSCTDRGYPLSTP